MENKTKIINKKMRFAEILEKYPETVEVFMKNGLHCIGCPMAQLETLEEGCKAHGINAKELVEKINKKLKTREK